MTPWLILVTASAFEVVMALGESRDVVRLAGIAAVVTGVVLLQLSGHH